MENVDERSLHVHAFRGDETKVKQLLAAAAATTGLSDHLINEKDFKYITPLHYAARGGQLGCFKLIQQHGGAVEYITFKSRSTILHSAATGGNLELVKYLFTSYPSQMKEYLSKRNSHGKLPAHCAIKSANFELFTYLFGLDKEMHSNRCKTTKGENYLSLAVKFGYSDMANKILLKHSNEVLSQVSVALISKYVVKSGDVQLFDFAQERIIQPAKELYDKKVRKPINPLYFAVEGVSIEILNKLENSELNDCKEFRDIRKNLFLTPIGYAAYIGNINMFSKLLSMRPEVSFKQSVPLLHATAEGGCLELVKLLLTEQTYSEEMSAQLKAITKTRGKKWNVFHFAASKPTTKIPAPGSGELVMKYLIQYFRHHGLMEKLEEFMKPGNDSVLHVACDSGNIDCVKFLLEETAFFDSLDVDSLLIGPLRNRRKIVIEYLVNKFPERINVFAIDGNNGTVIHQLARWMDDEDLFATILKLSLKKEQEPKFLDKQNISALRTALEYGNSKTASILLDHYCFDDTDKHHGFFMAAKGGNIQCLNKVIKHYNMDVHEELRKFSEHRKLGLRLTPLHAAVYHQHFDMVKHLVVDLKAPVQCVGGEGITPLHLACHPFYSTSKTHTSPPPSVDILNFLLAHCSMRFINHEAERFPGVHGTDLTASDVAHSKEMRQILAALNPTIAASRVLIPIGKLPNL